MTLSVGRCGVRVVVDRPWGSETDADWIALVRSHLARGVLPALDVEISALGVRHVPGTVRLSTSVTASQLASALSTPSSSEHLSAAHADVAMRAQVHVALLAAGAVPEVANNTMTSISIATEWAAVRARSLTALVRRARSRLGRLEGTPRPSRLRQTSAPRPAVGLDQSPVDPTADPLAQAARSNTTDRAHPPSRHERDLGVTGRSEIAEPRQHHSFGTRPTVEQALERARENAAQDGNEHQGSIATPKSCPVGDEAAEIDRIEAFTDRRADVAAMGAVLDERGDGLADAPDDSFASAGTVEHHISSCLPFLLLGPLAELGVLDTIAVSFDDSDLLDQLGIFAAALAARAPPPALGWYRRPEDLAAVALFAGLDDPTAVREDRFDSDDPFHPIRTVIVDAAVAGRDSGAPLLATTIRGGLIVAEAIGGFPLVWGAHAVEATTLYERLGGPMIVASGQQADRLGRLAARLDAIVPAQARRPVDDVFDLVATSGLALLAWQLTGGKDHPDALLALEHFADLDADVTVSAERVEVRLPLGARFYALARADLLGPVTDVPWLPGITIEMTAV